MTEDDRLAIVAELRCVDEAFVAVDDDATVVASLRRVREHYPDAELLFCNGGDRSDASDPVPSAETHLTEEIGLQMVYGVGGEDKADSSSRINEELSRSDIPASSPADMPTFAELLAAELRRDPGRPLLTWYDERHRRAGRAVGDDLRQLGGQDRLAARRGARPRARRRAAGRPAEPLAGTGVPRRRLDRRAGGGLPAVGDATPDAVVCGPAALATWAPRADDLPVLACSLLPMGVRFAEPLPPGVHDVGVEVWGQPDAFTPYDPPDGADVALVDGPVTQDELFSAAARSPPGESHATSTGGDRLLSTANPASPPGVAAVSRPLVSGGSLVLVTGADPARLDAIAEAERVTHRLG